MKNIYLNIFKYNKNILSKSIKYLKKNQIVSLPTETVYGLAGNAYSKQSISRIYKLKKRPKNNPLIIHYYNFDDASKDVIFNKKFYILYKKFCPGPLTFILKKKKNSKLNFLATSKLDTVAVRFPKHMIIRNILKKLKFPLAIPSANKSFGISPVSSEDVYEEFKNKIKMIVDGGRCKIGIESTIIKLIGKIKVLRPGAISLNQINMILKNKIQIQKKQKIIISPGAFKKHYSPNIPMFLNQKNPKKNYAFIGFGKYNKNKKNIFNLSKNYNLNEAAKNLYGTLRLIKKLKYKKIYVAKIPSKGIGLAINDRLKHAAN